jgi:hypothetical protein
MVTKRTSLGRDLRRSTLESSSLYWRSPRSSLGASGSLGSACDGCSEDIFHCEMTSVDDHGPGERVLVDSFYKGRDGDHGVCKPEYVWSWGCARVYSESWLDHTRPSDTGGNGWEDAPSVSFVQRLNALRGGHRAASAELRCWAQLLRSYDVERSYCGVSGCSAAAAAEIISRKSNIN